MLPWQPSLGACADLSTIALCLPCHASCLLCLQGYVDVVLSATSHLTHLTHLNLVWAPVQDTTVLRHLPASLQELKLSLESPRDRRLALGHLTAVTCMCSHRHMPVHWGQQVAELHAGNTAGR